MPAIRIKQALQDSAPSLHAVRDAETLSDHLVPRSAEAYDATTLEPRTQDALIYADSPYSNFPANRLQARQNADANGQIIAIPLTYRFGGPDPGAVVGIVLGSVVGFLFLFWITWFLTNAPGGGAIEGDETDIVVERRSTHGSRRSRRTRRHARSEMSESTRNSPPPPRRRTERIIVEETRRTERSAPPPPPSGAPSVASPETERRVAGDDIVEVVEQESSISSVPRRKSKRHSGYRPVDPNAYAGGNFERREVFEQRRSTSRRR